MFSRASVILSTGTGTETSPRQRPLPPGQRPTPPGQRLTPPGQRLPWMETPLVLTSSGGYCSGRYAFYLNAFLFTNKFSSCHFTILHKNSLQIFHFTLS